MTHKHDDLPPDVKENEELTREELSESLDECWSLTPRSETPNSILNHKRKIDEQAYQQIKKLIENYDPDTAMWMDRYHELEIKLAAQKTNISGIELMKAEVEEIACELKGMMFEDDIRDELICWLKSKGIEVEE